MSYTIERLSHLPVLLAVWQVDFEYMRDGKAFATAVHDALDQQTSPVFYMLDISPARLMTLEEIVKASNNAARGADPNFHHAKTRAVLVVSDEEINEVIVKGLQTPAFGNVNIQLFKTREAAFGYVREHA